MLKYGMKKILILFCCIIIIPAGCGRRLNTDTDAEPGREGQSARVTEAAGTVSEEAGGRGTSGTEDKDVIEETKAIAELYRDIYEKAVRENKTGSQELARDIISRLGENGYAAVDTENQINMVNPDLVRNFCGKVEEKEEAEATILTVMEKGDIVRYDLGTAGGTVDVVRMVLNWKNGVPDVTYQNAYPAYSWTYGNDGYLFFDEYVPPGYDGPPGFTAIRVEPLDPGLRELNEKYILPPGYDLNNMFTADWNEEDYGELNFYDLYERMYQMKYGRAPFEAAIDSEVYRVPEEIFESVFTAYFRLDSKVLRQYTDYLDKENAYRYRTRGQYDFAPTPSVPYPEVTAWEENTDGTITLTVNAVWPREHLARAFSHEVVIRLLEDGRFQYVSNHVIPSENNVEPVWYTDRLSEEQWENYYGERFLPVT